MAGPQGVALLRGPVGEVLVAAEEEVAVVVVAQDHGVGHPGLPMDVEEGDVSRARGRE